MKLTIRCFLALVVYCFGFTVRSFAQGANVFDVAVTGGPIFQVVGHTNYVNSASGDFPTQIWATFADGYIGSDPKGVDLPTAGGSAAHNGQMDSYPGGFSQPVHAYYSYTFNYTDPTYSTFGPAKTIHLETAEGFTGGQPVVGFTTDIGNQGDPPQNYTHGAVLVEARLTGDGGKTFTPATGATVQMYINANFPSPTKVGNTATPGSMVSRSSTAVHFVFGTSDATGSNNPDAPFPSGLANDNVQVVVTYKGQSKSWSDNAANIILHTENVGFVFGANTSTSATVYADGAATPDGLNPATGSGSSSGTGGTGSGSIFDLDSFFDRLKQFFSDTFGLPDTQRDALYTAVNNFVHAGPMAMLPSMVSVLGSLNIGYQGAPYITTDPTQRPYWSWAMYPENQFTGAVDQPTVIGPYGPMGDPFGYDIHDDPEQSYNDVRANVYLEAGYLPQWIDLSPFKRELLWLRRILFGWWWLLFAQRLIQQFTPKFRV